MMTKNEMNDIRISIVTPTLDRPSEALELIRNLSEQTRLPYELIIVDGASDVESATETAISKIPVGNIPFCVNYIRCGGGTAIQRNVGIEAARGDFVAFVDDDIRLDVDFFARILAVYAADSRREIGGVVGYRINEHITPATNQRWRWYKALRLLATYEPGRYDFKCGYPINVNLHPPFHGIRPVDFMTSSCAVWRRAVFDRGLRFDFFFRDYGVLEDAHFSLRAGREWSLFQDGDARCVHLHSPRGRADPRGIGYKSVVNYYYVFHDVAGPLSTVQQFRFWRYQLFELFRIAMSALRRLSMDDVHDLRGRIEGIVAVVNGEYLCD